MTLTTATFWHGACKFWVRIPARCPSRRLLAWRRFYKAADLTAKPADGRQRQNLACHASFCTVRTTYLCVMQGFNKAADLIASTADGRHCRNLACHASFCTVRTTYYSHNAGLTRLQTSSLAWQTGATTLTCQMALLASTRGCATVPPAS